MRAARITLICIVIAGLILGFGAGIVCAQVYIFANGGAYWSQAGSSWNTISNDGFCISGRGPCGPGLWYLQWTWNHGGCGHDESGRWNWPAEYELQYNGRVYAWIDSSTGSIWAADYLVTYGGASDYYVAVDQSAYSEAWAPVGPALYRPRNLDLTDAWGVTRICDSATGYSVEFDEIKLEY